MAKKIKVGAIGKIRFGSALLDDVWGVKIGNRWARFKDWDKLTKKPMYQGRKLYETAYAVTQSKKEAEKWAKQLRKVM